ncbi:hypothetical protein HanPSC8_Chr08g0322531 [Helianthus annuus]|nr:hypothetical protein HanPSC8_Chr08g0322531 [Helianthus annuus]
MVRGRSVHEVGECCFVDPFLYRITCLILVLWRSKNCFSQVGKYNCSLQVENRRLKNK